ncbi:hypothetical protein K438DRAFT_1664771, partial [Mycena galopus ATCC 62051]
MSANDNAAIQSLTDNERLINALQACFADFLKEQKEQTNRLVQELRPKPWPTPDKKTTFWKRYKTLADEHDKALLQRYSTDLDSTLIFAGIFSAVDSAFIIQIQPQFPDPSRIMLAALSLLYFSLGATLFAALLAVLGKQWLTCYSAGEKQGTIETRGLQHQQKLDGMRKWKFEMIIQ